MSEEYQLPTVPGLYVADTAVMGDNPAGAVIWVLDEDGNEWYEYGAWADEFPETYPYAYPEGLKEAARKYGWEMLLLVPTKVG